MVDGIDFTVQDVLQRGTTGAQIHKQYTLTPEAFKKCLMRTQRRPNQPIDPEIYCDYYLLLEDVHDLFNKYTLAYTTKSNEQLTTKNDDLQSKLDALLSMSAQTIEGNQKLHEDNQVLIKKVDNLHDDNVNMLEKMDNMQETMTNTNDTVMNMMIMQAPKSRDNFDPMFCIMAVPYLDHNGIPYILVELVRRQRSSIVKYVNDYHKIMHTLVFPFILPAQPNLCHLVQDTFKSVIGTMIFEHNKGKPTADHLVKSVFTKSTCKWGAREIRLYVNPIVDINFIIKLFIDMIIKIRTFDNDTFEDNTKIALKQFAKEQLDASHMVDFAYEKKSVNNMDKLAHLHATLKDTYMSHMDYITQHNE